MKYLWIILLVWINILSADAAITFSEAIALIDKHESVLQKSGKSRAVKEMAKSAGSWGDPQFKIAAKNFPQDNIRDDQTPMTGIEFGVSTKVALTTKFGNLRQAMESTAESFNFSSDDQKQSLYKILWETLISKRKIEQEIKILKENSQWIAKILRISKKLYANGKTGQQAVLDIEIRKSEIESSLSTKSFEKAQIKDRLVYLVGHPKINDNSVPWKILLSHTKAKDYRELALKKEIQATEKRLTAARLNYIPDLTVSLGVTKRANIDGNGDFVSAAVSFPLPFSGDKYAKNESAVQHKYSAIKKHEHYKRSKERTVAILKKEIASLEGELSILESKTIKFANNSRSITSKSYRYGGASYIELLQSELKLQEILMRKVMLVALRDQRRVTLKYTLGENLDG